MARFICFTAHCGGTEKAKQTMRASHSSKSSLCCGSLVWCTVRALSPGTNLARRRRARSPANAPTLPSPARGGGLGRGLLELLDLLRRPRRRHADQRVGDRAFGKIIELPELAPQRDVDRHQHLLHRRIAIDLVGAHVAWPVDDVARGVVDCGQAFEHLLISRRIDGRAVGRGKRQRRAAPVVDYALDA